MARGTPRSGGVQYNYWYGKRVELHPGTDAWMRGDRYGTVIAVGNNNTLRVKMDRSGRTFRVPRDSVNVVD